MSFTIRWLGQGGFFLRMGEKTLCIDPYLSDSVGASSDGFFRIPPIPVAPEALKCDLLLSTHDHMDHLDPDTISHTNLPLYAGPQSCLEHFRALGIEENRLLALDRGSVHMLGDARLTGVYADHTVDSIGLVVEYEGIRVYITGDSLYNDRLFEVGKMGIDVLFVCVNGRLGNMTAAEAAQLAEKLPCRLAVPMHYGMFRENTVDPREFTDALAGSNIPCAVLEMDREYDLAELLEKAQ